MSSASGTSRASASCMRGVEIRSTEKLRSAFDGHPEALASTAEHAETPEFTGYLIDALFHDDDLKNLSGHTFIGAELAGRYGITDEGVQKNTYYKDNDGDSFGGGTTKTKASLI